jgi:hypothetical protein
MQVPPVLIALFEHEAAEAFCAFPGIIPEDRVDTLLQKTLAPHALQVIVTASGALDSGCLPRLLFSYHLNDLF